MRSTRKILAVMMAVVLVLAFASCTQTSAPATTGTAAPTTAVATTKVATSPTTAPEETSVADTKYDPPITVTSVTNYISSWVFPEGDTIESNLWTRAYKEKLGIELKYNWVSADEGFSQKFNSMLASNDLPDFFNVGQKDLADLTEAGSLYDLTDVYDKNASALTKQQNANGQKQFESGIIGGKLMGMNMLDSAIDSAQVLFVRKDWLDKLGLQLPKTTDDVMNISKAFTERDPDGNGQNDTKGMIIDKQIYKANNGTGYCKIDGFCAGFHAYPNSWIKDASGNLIYGSIQPEMKTALAKLQEMYKKGWLDPEFGTADFPKNNEVIASGKVGLFYSYFWYPYYMKDSWKNDPKADWVTLPVVSSDSKQATQAVPTVQAPAYYVVNKNCKHPEALIKMINLYFDLITNESGTYWTNSEGILVYQYALTRIIPPHLAYDKYNALQAVFNGSASPSSIPAAFTSEYTNAKSFMDKQPSKDKDGKEIADGWKDLYYYYMCYGPTGNYSVIKQYTDDPNALIYDQFFGAPGEAQSQYGSALETLQLQAFTNIIKGTESIDAFDTFVKNWKSGGGDAWTTEVNAWYKARQ